MNDYRTAQWTSDALEHAFYPACGVVDCECPDCLKAEGLIEKPKPAQVTYAGRQIWGAGLPQVRQGKRKQVAQGQESLF